MKNDPISSIIHMIGTGLAIAGLVLLVVFATGNSAWYIVSYSIFGASMILLYLASSIYHISYKGSKIRRIFERLDHLLIFVLIAGTYTPICLGPLRGGWGFSIFGIIWGLALIGIIIKLTVFEKTKKASVALYLAMGWLIMICFYKVIEIFTIKQLFWLCLGGGLYTVGVIFLALSNRFRYAHAIWHLFVLAGTFSHFWLMLLLVN